MTDIKDIKPGDVVAVRAVVDRIANDGFPEVHAEGRYGTWTASVSPDDIVSVEPRPLKVGDRVRHKMDQGEVGEIIAVDGSEAWVRFSYGCGTRALSDLERA